MKHIISNPHNGSPIDHDGVILAPGYEQVVSEQAAAALSERFPFLLVRTVSGSYNPAKPGKAVKIKGKLEFQTEVVDDPDVADQVTHTASKK